MIGGFLDDALGEVEGLGLDVVEALLAHFDDDVLGGIGGYCDADDIVEIFLEIYLGLLIGHGHLLETVYAI